MENFYCMYDFISAEESHRRSEFSDETQERLDRVYRDNRPWFDVLSASIRNNADRGKIYYQAIKPGKEDESRDIAWFLRMFGYRVNVFQAKEHSEFLIIWGDNISGL